MSSASSKTASAPPGLARGAADERLLTTDASGEPFEAADVDRVDECRQRARHAQDCAAAAAEAELRERHLDRAALWSAIADLLVRHRAATLQAWFEARADGEEPDPSLLEDYLCEAAAHGTA